MSNSHFVRVVFPYSLLEGDDTLCGLKAIGGTVKEGGTYLPSVPGIPLHSSLVMCDTENEARELATKIIDLLVSYDLPNLEKYRGRWERFPDGAPFKVLVDDTLVREGVFRPFW